MKTIEIDYLRSLLRYDPDTGLFTWRRRPRNEFSSDRIYNSWNAKYSGKNCGSLTNKYRTLRINDSQFYCHRLAWAIHYGEWPESDVDHINMVKTDNRIQNLRLSSRRQNMSNIKATKANKSGLIGVYWAKRERKWVAGITIDYKFNFLGYYDDPHLAASAYNAACEKANGKYADKKIEYNLSKILRS